MTCGDAGSRRENVAHSNLDLAALVPAGDKENLTTERFLAASAPLQERQKCFVCGLCPGSHQRARRSRTFWVAGFRGELLARSNAISAQMKTLIFANLGTVVSIAPLAFGVAELS